MNHIMVSQQARIHHRRARAASAGRTGGGITSRLHCRHFATAAAHYLTHLSQIMVEVAVDRMFQNGAIRLF